MDLKANSATSTSGGAAAGGIAMYALANGVARRPLAQDVASSAGAVWGNGLEKLPVLPKIVGAYGGRRAAQWIIETHAPEMPQLLQRGLVDGVGPDIGMRSRDLNKVVEALRTQTNTLALAGAEGVKKIAPQLAGEADAAAAHLVRLNEVLTEHGARIASTALGAAGGRGVLRGVVLLAGAAGAGIGAWQGHKHADDKAGAIGYTVAGGTALALLAGVALTRHLHTGAALPEVAAEAQVAKADADDLHLDPLTYELHDDVQTAATPAKPLDLEVVKRVQAHLFANDVRPGVATHMATEIARSDLDPDVFMRLQRHMYRTHGSAGGENSAQWARHAMEKGHDISTYTDLHTRLSRGMEGIYAAEWADRLMSEGGHDLDAFVDLQNHHAKHGYGGWDAAELALRQLAESAKAPAAKSTATPIAEAAPAPDVDLIRKLHAHLYAHGHTGAEAQETTGVLIRDNYTSDAFMQTQATLFDNGGLDGKDSVRWARNVLSSGVDVERFHELQQHLHHTVGLDGYKAASWANRLLDRGFDVDRFLDLVKFYRDNGLDGNSAATAAYDLLKTPAV